MSYSKGTHKVVDHRRSLYQTKKKAQKKELEVDGNTYIITIPSGNEAVQNDRSKEKYKEVYDYLKNNYQTIGETGIMVFDKEEDDVLSPHIRAIRKAFTETGLGWGKDCKFWYKNLYFYDNLPDQYLKQTFIAISPKEGSSVRAKQVKKKEKPKTLEELKPGESIELDEADIEFGDEILPSVTQNVTVKKEPKKIPIQTRKEFTQRIKDEKERHYKEFLETYYKHGVDSIGTTKSYVASRRPYSEAEHYVFKDKNPEAWNKIVKKHPELAKHKKLLKDPKNFFENFYYLESESEPSEGFLSSEAEIESEYQGESSEYEYDPDTSHGYAEGYPYSDLEKEEEVIEKMPAPEPASAPAPAPPPAPSSKQKRRDQLRERRQMKKKSESAKAPAPATGSMPLDEFNIRRDLYKKSKVINDNPALKEAGWEVELDKIKKEHYYMNKKTGEKTLTPPTPPSGGKKTRKRNKISKKYKMKKTKKTKRISRLRGGKRTKKKKSTRKKKRGGVGPSVPPVSRVNQTRRSRVRQGPALLQGLNQLRDMDHAYIGVAMERLSTPDLVLALDQEGTLDNVMGRVTERITFFINRNQENIDQLRDFLDETTEAQQTLDRADGNLGDRYRNFIQQLRALTDPDLRIVVPDRNDLNF